MKLSILSWVVAAAVFSGPAAFAGIIFDNADAPLNTTFRSSSNLPLGVAAYIQIGGSDVNITQIAINAAPGQSGQLEFVIFSDVTPPGSNAGSLLLSDTVNVTSSATLNYILSDPISFTLLAGHFYDIGAIFNGSSINYSYDLVANTMGGISSIVSNQNVDAFANPVLTGHAGADINIQLFGGTSAVPEPVSVVLTGLGLAAIGLRRLRNRNISA